MFIFNLAKCLYEAGLAHSRAQPVPLQVIITAIIIRIHDEETKPQKHYTVDIEAGLWWFWNLNQVCRIPKPMFFALCSL